MADAFPRGERLASVVRLLPTAGPAPERMSGGSAPHFRAYGTVHAVVNSYRSSAATSSPDAFGEDANASDSTAMRLAIRAPDEWAILNVPLL